MKNVLLIGVDGGATEVKAHAATCADFAQARGLALRPETAARVYQRLPEFKPLPVAEQLAQRDGDRIERTPAEVEQARLFIQAAADAIVDVAGQCKARRVLVGEGMPGLKTPDGRGINVINNGPRMPDYLAQLEALLAAAGLELAAPIAALGSDADYCGLGEEHAADGLFREVDSAYYVGCGTGIADALKLRGALVPFDATKPWLLKSWQIPSALGLTFEKLVSASSMNRVFHDLRPAAAAEGTFPEVAAAEGDGVAVAWMQTVALVLAELIFERIWTLKNGRAEAAYRGDAYAKLTPEHPYQGLIFDRVIIGQRLGLMYADTKYHAVFGDRVDACLTAFIAGSGDGELELAYLSANGRLKPGLLCASRLRAAPALGAAVAAVRASRA